MTSTAVTARHIQRGDKVMARNELVTVDKVITSIGHAADEYVTLMFDNGTALTLKPDVKVLVEELAW